MVDLLLVTQVLQQTVIQVDLEEEHMQVIQVEQVINLLLVHLKEIML